MIAVWYPRRPRGTVAPCLAVGRASGAPGIGWGSEIRRRGRRRGQGPRARFLTASKAIEDDGVILTHQQSFVSKPTACWSTRPGALTGKSHLTRIPKFRPSIRPKRCAHIDEKPSEADYPANLGLLTALFFPHAVAPDPPLRNRRTRSRSGTGRPSPPARQSGRPPHRRSSPYTPGRSPARPASPGR